MNVEVVEANDAEQAILRNLFTYYFQDMAQYDDGIRINEFGLPVWHSFLDAHPRTHEEMVTANWWIRDSCHRFLIRADGIPAGFVIVNAGPHFLPEGIDYDIQDFFILAKFRRQGVGRTAAKTVFATFRGRWEVIQLARNAPAIAFWNRVVAEVTDGHYEVLDNGARQRFRNDNPVGERAIQPLKNA